jgi:uncharacterized RDD family membrane protein YckC
MENITIHTTQNIDIDHEIGGLGERILGFLIDIAVFIPFVIAGMIIASSLSPAGIGIYFITLGVLYTFYDLIFETFFNGQSIGKRVMKIRVISLDGGRPRFSQYLLRWLFRPIDFGITGGVCALISAAITEKGQRVGDLVAGTVLIRTVPRTTRNNIIFQAVEDNYQATFPQVSQLSDKDLALIHDVIENYFATGGNNLVYQMADKVRSHLAISVPPNMNSLQFLQTIAKDYSHVTAQADMG